MEIIIKRKGDAPLMRFDYGYNNALDTALRVKSRDLRGYPLKDFVSVTFGDEDISEMFKEFMEEVTPCACGNYGDPQKKCLCSAGGIYRWRKEHNLDLSEFLNSHPYFMK